MHTGPSTVHGSVHIKPSTIHGPVFLKKIPRVNCTVGWHRTGLVRHRTVRCSVDQNKLSSFEPDFSKLFSSFIGSLPTT
jgi:hypothetical protein